MDLEARLAELRKVGTRSAIVGKEAESPRKFYTLSLGEPEAFVVGVISSGLGINPAMVHVPCRNLVVIGHDTRVTAANTQSGIAKWVFPLDGVFFDFVHLDQDCVTLVHELGAVRVDLAGKRLWGVSTDIVVGFRLTDDGLEIQSTDGRMLHVDIESGREA
jgi:hypothetical protein